MNLWQLNIFCKVIELKSFSKAGKEICISQPTISSHIKDLENYFNCRLIDRLGKEAVPTKTGNILFLYAKRMLSLKNEAETAIFEFHGQIKGRLVIGGSTIPGTYILPQYIGSFINNFPDVKISLLIGDTKEIINKIINREIEIGIVGSKSTSKQIDQKKIFKDQICLVVKKNHKWADKKSIDLKMLINEPFIIREKGSGTLDSIQKNLSDNNYSLNDLNIIAEMGSTSAVCQGIKQGIGVSILSKIAVSEELKHGSLKAIMVEGINPCRFFYLTSHKNLNKSPLCNKFNDFIISNIKKHT